MNFNILTQTELHNYLFAHGAITSDGAKVDCRTLKKLPGMTDDMAEQLFKGCKLYKSRVDEAARKRKMKADPVYNEKRLEGDRKRKKEYKENETDAEYERRRERERETEARCRENRKADSVRYEAAKQVQHRHRTTLEFRAKVNAAHAAKPEPARQAQRNHYAKQKAAGITRKSYQYTEETRLARNERRKEKEDYPYYKVQQSARFHNIKLELTEDQTNLIAEQECHYCGASPADGIDRQNSNQHYCLSNVVSCCAMCNKMKGGHLPNVFQALATAVTHHAQDPSVCATDFYMGDTSFAKCRHSANKRGISFNLTSADYENIIARSCLYCGAPGPVGIDRVDSNVGYIVSNISPCCSYCNWMKNDFSSMDFITQCTKIAKHMPVCAFSSSLCGCGKPSVYNTCFCMTCYFSCHYNKHRNLSSRAEYDTVLAKKCLKCNITKQSKFFIEESCAICLDCQSKDY